MKAIVITVMICACSPLLANCLVKKTECNGSLIEQSGYEAGISLENRLFNELYHKNGVCNDVLSFFGRIDLEPALLVLEQTATKYLTCRNLGMFHQRDRNIQRVIEECGLNNELVAINEATAEVMLTKLVDANPEMIAAIIDYRIKNNGIKNCQELSSIQGITEAFIAKNKNRIIFTQKNESITSLR